MATANESDASSPFVSVVHDSGSVPPFSAQSFHWISHAVASPSDETVPATTT